MRRSRSSSTWPTAACSVVLGAGAMDKDQSRFLLDVGADLSGRRSMTSTTPWSMPSLGDDLMQSPVLNYTPALRRKPIRTRDAGPDSRAVLQPDLCALLLASEHAAPAGRAAHPAVIQKGKCDLRSQSAGSDVRSPRSASAPRSLRGGPQAGLHGALLAVDMPSAGASACCTSRERRYVAHCCTVRPTIAVVWS